MTDVILIGHPFDCSIGETSCAAQDLTYVDLYGIRRLGLRSTGPYLARGGGGQWEQLPIVGESALFASRCPFF